MSTDASALPADVATCHALIAQLEQTVTAQQRKLAQLEHSLAQLLRLQYGPRSENFDPRQQSLFEAEALAESPAPAPPVVETRVKSHVRRGGGRQELPPDLPRERIEHDLAEEQKPCPGCGELRQRIGCETSEQLEFVPASLKVLVHVRHKYACKSCQEHVAIADAPVRPIEKGLPGPGLLASVAVSKYSDHLPLYRLEDIFSRHGVELSRSTLSRWAARTADLLEPLYGRMIERVRLSAVIHTDDTPVSVLDPSLPKTRTGRFWVYIGDDDNPYSVYDYTTSRRRDGPAGFLKDFYGYLQADAFAGYDGIYAAGTVQQVLCWAHARRKFFEAKEAHPTDACAAMAFIARLYEVEREAKGAAPEDLRTNVPARGKWFAERKSLRQERSLPLLAEFRTWLEGAQARVLPKSPFGQALGYVLPRWEGLARYCADGRLAIDNNLSERTLRACAIGRKNWLFLGSDRGGKTAAILFSVMASCKANQVEPFAYVRDVLTRLCIEVPSTHEDLDALLPDAWLKTHPEAQRTGSR
jgi:transposase